MTEISKHKADLSTAFAQVRQRFEQALPARAAAMRALVNSDELADNDLQQLIYEAHKLAGACGTFGFHNLGGQARILEQLARTVEAKPAAQQRQARQTLEYALQDFRRRWAAPYSNAQPYKIIRPLRSGCKMPSGYYWVRHS